MSAFNAYSEPTTDCVTAHGKGDCKTSNGLVTIKAVEKSQASLKIPDLRRNQSGKNIKTKSALKRRFAVSKETQHQKPDFKRRIFVFESFRVLVVAVAIAVGWIFLNLQE